MALCDIIPIMDLIQEMKDQYPSHLLQAQCLLQSL
jgi:hypothetical protein